MKNGRMLIVDRRVDKAGNVTMVLMDKNGNVHYDTFVTAKRQKKHGRRA